MLAGGNFPLLLFVDPGDPRCNRARMRLMPGLSAEPWRSMERAPASNGIGVGKRTYLVDELGDAIETMRSMKRALGPVDIMNPRKILLS